MKALLGVLAILVAGLLVLALSDHWRLGAVLVGVAFCVGGALRLTLPAAQLGDLVVRSRLVDAFVLLAVGFGLVALANTLPGGH